MNWSLNAIRKIFLDYFIINKHHHCKSDSLIPKSDTSLLFTNSGMVQFKNIFLGNEVREYQKAVSVQKCLRAGGKHNDLEQVGYTKRHLTFFEMLGNFSFGNYFKEEAIYHAWNLITEYFHLNPERLYITVYHKDTESFNIWKKITNFPDKKIIKIDSDDNFWKMSDRGPCGPCSEIFFDRGEKFSGGMPGTQGQDGDRFLEIWNLVFMQFNQISDSKFSELSIKSVDTGMGLERIASVLQSVDSNFEIDIFKNIISYIEDVVQVKSNLQNIISYRIIADHIRAASFLIAEDLLPSNESSGYVLRRILRRSIRHIQNITQKEEPLLYKISPIIVEMFHEIYPELKENAHLITEVIKSEEERFNKTLGNGLRILNKFIQESNNSTFSGKNAFILYDTYGFPLEITKEIILGQGLILDQAEFDDYMNSRKILSKKSWLGNNIYNETTEWLQILKKFGPSQFIGYNDHTKAEAQVLSILFNEKQVEKISLIQNAQFMLILNQTVFYAESGGQGGDIGYITFNNHKIKILDTKKYVGELHVHICLLEQESANNDESSSFLCIGDSVSLFVDKVRRNKLKKNHTATHLLNFALRELIGKDIIQKGSYIADNYLRFDFNYIKGLSTEQIYVLESFINDKIAQNLPIITQILPKEEAFQVGAIGIFGEKYKDLVRVVSIGSKISSERNESYSIELCGGTHVKYTGEIGVFKIISEKSISSGVRRIEAQTGQEALQSIQTKDSILHIIASKLKTDVDHLINKVDLVIENNKNIHDQNKSLISDLLYVNSETILKQSIKLPKIRIFAKKFNNIAPQILLKSAQKTSVLLDNLLVFYVVNFESKNYLILVNNQKEIDNDNFTLENISKGLLQNLKFTKNWGNVNFRQIILNEKISFHQLIEKLIKFFS